MILSSYIDPQNVVNINEGPASSLSNNQDGGQDFRNAEVMSLKSQLLFSWIFMFNSSL